MRVMIKQLDAQHRWLESITVSLACSPQFPSGRQLGGDARCGAAPLLFDPHLHLNGADEYGEGSIRVH